MASREFTDGAGREWRVWDVKPTAPWPVARTDTGAEGFSGGWLVFESATEKRRLPAPFPPLWDQFDLEQLEAMCERAQPVTPRQAARIPSGEQLAIKERSADVEARAQSERSFRSRRGREWRVRLHEYPRPYGGSETVLRYTCDDLVLDVRDWPANWKDLGREAHALLILEAGPPRRPGAGEHPMRRREDHVEG